ncbi:hypothetical protein [Flavobacterium enshiense]|uniref:hypothetical protein n=1 Tax=Flavobacterium enshiense TaxID=1341165 RepID=UPI00345DBB40
MHCVSQNYRDKVIHEALNPVLDVFKPVPHADYLKAKELILKLDEDYGYEADLHLKLLNLSYKHNDLDFFKAQLSQLVERHGFTIAYMTGQESYDDAILKGDLAAWFKPMYIKNHAIWLEKNFEKQLDLKKLNDARLRDQVISSFGVKIHEKIKDTLVYRQITDIQNEMLFNVVTDVYKISRKYDLFPNGKNFGLVQQDFSLTMQRNFMMKSNLERTWILFEPYLRKGYLKHDLDYGFFKKYDIYSYAVTGYQKYGLATVGDLPAYFTDEREQLKEIPVQNAFFADKTKREMGW